MEAMDMWCPVTDKGVVFTLGAVFGDSICLFSDMVSSGRETILVWPLAPGNVRRVCLQSYLFTIACAARPALQGHDA